MPARFRKSATEARVTPESVVAGLNLGDQVTFDEVLAKVEEAHGKPIELREVDNSIIPTVTGLWIEKEKKSIILVPERDTRLHRHHTVCHEFGHILFNHDGCGLTSDDMLTSADMMPSMFQHIGGRRGIKRMLARSFEWNETERAAEHIAYLLSLALLPQERASSSDFERTFT